MRPTVPDVRSYFTKAYSEKLPSRHEWTAGTASPELIKLVWDQTIKPHSKVIEVGCGIGTEAVFLAVRDMEVTAVDISESAIETARKLADVYGVNVDFHVADALNLPVGDGEFDVFCDQGCFHHLTDEERGQYVKEVLRVLKPGGLFVLRSFSDKIPGGPQPRRISSKELIDTFASHFYLEHLERVLSFSTEQRQFPLGWFSLWFKSE
ncbi:class I SAM-dependent methyltransferase [Laceyella sacchari]|jgi:ubiquinone/menaquinone biosynthesis C-methylase UbiE|uniref:Class I SAM-dependent methyltransferase n=1 Tax=Laceyella sacchari TaxID=37482 RepID=A0ABY5U5J1_LACSH|nr:class I SAM-dependent methyltransferase [Laceyella sacchari]UWE03318.1 class I SAM-dependent methyltransferase [Laceyella sacchari]